MAATEEVVTLTQVISDSGDDLEEGDGVALIEHNDIETTVTPHNTHYCGILACHPTWLQVFAKKKVFTFLLFLFALVEGAIVSGRYGFKKFRYMYHEQETYLLYSLYCV